MDLLRIERLGYWAGTHMRTKYPQPVMKNIFNWMPVVVACGAVALGSVPLKAANRATVGPPKFEGDQVRFDWNTGGDLQVAPTPNGPWTTVRSPQQKSSTAQLPAIQEGAFFFRIVDQGLPGVPQPIVGGDPARPFRIAKAFLRKASLGNEGNAVVEMELEPGQNPPTQFPLLFGAGVVTFHDDGKSGDAQAGDGVFTGPLFFDENEFLGANQLIDGLLRRFPVIGSFDGRAVVSVQKPALFDMDEFNRGGRLLIHPSPFRTGLPNQQGVALAGEPGRRGASKAALLGLPDSVETVCLTNVIFREVLLTNLVTKPTLEPQLVFTNFAVTNIICTNVVVAGVPTQNITNLQALLDRPIFWDKSLLITDLSVVEDPRRTFDPCTGRGTKMGAWTFGRLMADMANQPATGIHPSDFARRWLRSWQTDQVINFDTVNQRNAEIIAQVIQDWEAASGGPEKPLDLSIAPFRLLAIVNRVDLRLNPGYGGPTGDDPCNPACLGGEGRFVFSLIRDAFKGGEGRPPAPGYGGGTEGGGNLCEPAPFTVIFEYCVPKRTCAEIKSYAEEWYKLSLIEFGGIFNAALEQITDQFAARGADPARKPNQSALNQLRSNELLVDPWELREWKLFGNDSDAGHLREVTVKQTPDIAHNFQKIIAEFCLANAAEILAEKHTVPLMWRSPGKPEVPFLGGVAPMSTKDFFWDGPPPAATSMPNEIRHRFSLNTCNGCHAGETRTAFTHVFPRPAGAPAALSDFLTGLGMPKIDPADNVTNRVFADLKRREDDLLRLLVEPCFFQVFHDPVVFKH